MASKRMKCSEHRLEAKLTTTSFPSNLEYLRAYDGAPDDVIVRDHHAARVLDISVWTLRRRNPVPAIRLSPRCVGRRLGDLRRLIRGA